MSASPAGPGAPAPGPTDADADVNTLVVSEIYASVQGESSYVGIPCAFVRLTGCNLRCVWCDSVFSFHGGERVSVAEAAERALAFATEAVEVTGGEPLLQPAVHPLLARLCDAGRTVLLETGGSLDIGGVDPRVVRIVDLKCPGSGEAQRNRWENVELLRPRDEVKLVIADRADYEWAREVIRRHRLEERCRVLLGVVHGAFPEKDLVEWMLADRLRARFQTQLHKVLWPSEARGV